MKKHSDIYLDYITATPCPQKVKEQLPSLLDSDWASPCAPYPLGQKSASFIRSTQAHIQKKLQIETRTIQITHSRLEPFISLPYKQVLLSANEQLETLKFFFDLQDEEKIQVSLLPIGPRGYIEKATIEEAATSEKTLLLLSSVDLCSGVLQPLEALQTKDPLHILFDITHTFGKTGFSFDECQANDILFDLTALGSPASLICFLSKNECSSHTATPFEWKITESLIEESLHDTFLFSTEVVRLRDLFESELKKAIPESWILHQEEARIPHLSTAIFPNVKNEALLFLLSKKNLFASMGGGNRQTLSAQLVEQGYAPHIAQGALSFSFSTATTEEEILESIARIKESYELLTKIGLHDV